MVCIVVLFLSTSPVGAVVVHEPAAIVTVHQAEDFATVAFQDPWDMMQRTDFGWFLYSDDQPASSLADISFEDGIFSATTTSDDPLLFLLDTDIPGTAHLGKTGANFPIDADAYTMLTFRMKVGQPSDAQVFWSKVDMYHDINGAGNIAVQPGWGVYMASLPDLTQFLGDNPWAGTIRMLRFDPTTVAGDSIQIDWIRLAEDDASLYRTVSWSGAGPVDIYLDNDTNPDNGTLGAVARGVTGSTFELFVGGLPAGDYHVAVAPAGTEELSYSPGFFRVHGVPLLEFLAPGPEGSDDDFAEVQLGAAWDMSDLGDIDHTVNVTGLEITELLTQDEAGSDAQMTRVLSGVSTSAEPGFVGDPVVFPFWPGKRGRHYRIDPDRYRVLTLELGMPGNRDLMLGSVARVIWRVAGEAGENVSADIPVNHTEGPAMVLARVSADMKHLQLETDPGGSPSTSGWVAGTSSNPGIDGFRVDPHEFEDPTPFAIRRIKLSSFERAGSQYEIRWNISGGQCPDAQLDLFYDTAGSGFTGQSIVSGLPAESGSYTWDTGSLPHGEKFHIYAELSCEQIPVNRVYASWPVVRDAGYLGEPTRLYLGHDRIVFGATEHGAVLTSPQQVRVEVSGPGLPEWGAESDRDWILPAPASHLGAGFLTVAIEERDTYPAPALLDGLVSVVSPDTDNSPRYLDVVLNVYASGTTEPPFGAFETPAHGATGLSGAIPVTGWVLDDIEVVRVDIWRDPMPGEAVHPNGFVYLGDATFVPGARPDVEAAYPDHPLNYRAGWGYMLLSNFLPDNGVAGTVGGNGTFVLHAIAHDAEGHETLLGSHTITCDNDNATLPFGTIDVPGQGDTVSGTILNWAWALTPQPGMIPTDGSTITVYINGSPVGQPVYNLYREDIATLFPGYANTDGAVGYFELDTTTLPNGLHTIAWLVIDDLGRAQGIGSRYFWVFN